MKDFEKKIVNFAYEVEYNFTESIKDEQMGKVKKGQSLQESIEKYRKSKYVSKNTRPYIEHLENQVNLIDIFFDLMNSIRLKLKCFHYVINILSYDIKTGSCRICRVHHSEDNSCDVNLLHPQYLRPPD